MLLFILLAASYATLSKFKALNFYTCSVVSSICVVTGVLKESGKQHVTPFFSCMTVNETFWTCIRISTT